MSMEKRHRPYDECQEKGIGAPLSRKNHECRLGSVEHEIRKFYPLISPVKANGTAEDFRIDSVPADRYNIFLAFRPPDSDNQHELQARIQGVIDASPMDIRAVVTDRHGNELLQFEGDTTRWVAGSTATYRSDIRTTERYIAPFDPHNGILSFEARSFRDYRISLYKSAGLHGF